MKKAMMFVSLCISLSFGPGCSKNTPPPETPETQAASQSAPAPTAPRPDPVGTSDTELNHVGGGVLPQVLIWTDDGLKEVAPGTVLALPKGEVMVLHVYPQFADGALTFSGPLRLARQGGHAVLELVPDTARGTYDVRVKNGALPEFPLQVEVR